MGYGRYMISLLEEFMRTDIDMDSYGCSTLSSNETVKSFFSYMGMRAMEQGKNIPYIDTHEEGLHKRVNRFFDIAKNAMDRARCE